MSPHLESLGYSVAVVRDPQQRVHVDVALGAPRDGVPFGSDVAVGRTYLMQLAESAWVGVLAGGFVDGADLHWLGDADRDRWPDFAVTSIGGGIELASGASGRAIWTFDPIVDCPTVVSTVGDLDGDSVRELVVRNWARVREPIRTLADYAWGLEVWSGADRRVLRHCELERGFRYSDVVEAGDVDGDGGHELAVLAETDPGEGRIDVYVSWRSLTDLTEVRRASFGRAGPAKGERPGFGCVATLGALGDVDGDGSSEVLVGLVDLDEIADDVRSRPTSGFRPFGDDLKATGRIVAFDGRKGVELWRRTSELTDRTLRIAGTGGADVDGDGWPDALVSESYEAFTIETKRGILTVASGRNGSLVRRHHGPCEPTATFPHRALFVGDLDGDGVEEYLATETCGAFDVSGPNEQVRVFSGRTGHETLRFP